MIIIKTFKKEPIEGGVITLKKTLTFIPLGVGISAAIVYLFNIICFRVINNTVSLMQILSNLKIYLYISIGGFLIYFFIRILILLTEKNVSLKKNIEGERKELIKTSEVNNEVTPMVNEDSNLYVPNYDYVPVYKKENHEVIQELKVNEEKKTLIGSKYCVNCGGEVSKTDTYCKNCGSYQKKKKSEVNPVLKNIINVLEIIILLLVLYFSINILLDYK